MESTTQISELPIKPNIPHIEQSERSEQIDIRESSLSMDSGIHNNNQVPAKKVHFSKSDDDKVIEEDFTSNMSKPDVSYELKLILLASIIFFIFIDIKFKKYIIDILVQIFGSFLKNETGGTSKTGNIFYAITFGLTVYIFTRFVDMTSLQFSF